MLWLPIQKWECGEFGIHGYLEAAITWWTLFPGHLIFKISCSLWGLCLGIRPASKGGGGGIQKQKKKKKNYFFLGKRRKRRKRRKEKK